MCEEVECWYSSLYSLVWYISENPVRTYKPLYSREQLVGKIFLVFGCDPLTLWHTFLTPTTKATNTSSCANPSYHSLSLFWPASWQLTLLSSSWACQRRQPLPSLPSLLSAQLCTCICVCICVWMSWSKLLIAHREGGEGIQVLLLEEYWVLLSTYWQLKIFLTTFKEHAVNAHLINKFECSVMHLLGEGLHHIGSTPGVSHLTEWVEEGGET